MLAETPAIVRDDDDDGPIVENASHAFNTRKLDNANAIILILENVMDERVQHGLVMLAHDVSNKEQYRKNSVRTASVALQSTESGDEDDH